MPEKTDLFLQEEEVSFTRELKHMEQRGWKVHHQELSLHSEVAGPWPRGIRIGVIIGINPAAKALSCTFGIERKHRFTTSGKNFLDTLQQKSLGRVPSVQVNSARTFIFTWFTKTNDFCENPTSEELEKQVNDLVRIGGRFAYICLDTLTSFEKKGQSSNRNTVAASTYEKMATFCLVGFENEQKGFM
jgi:hypothetical protein